MSAFDINILLTSEFLKSTQYVFNRAQSHLNSYFWLGQMLSRLRLSTCHRKHVLFKEASYLW
jgi:hypothetical protein